MLCKRHISNSTVSRARFSYSKAELGSVTTPWGPNVYKGTGHESRVTMTVNVPDAIREQMECIKEKVRDLLRPHVPKIDAIWHSSTKPSDKHPSSLRAMINVSGDRVCPCVDVDGNSVSIPTMWAGLSVIPVGSTHGPTSRRQWLACSSR